MDVVGAVVPVAVDAAGAVVHVAVDAAGAVPAEDGLEDGAVTAPVEGTAGGDGAAITAGDSSPGSDLTLTPWEGGRLKLCCCCCWPYGM